jgi:pimeloyl-ACP methyl ester carboxylesterase
MRSIHIVEHHGCRLSCQVAGDGPPVVLIQGSGLHGSGWDPQVHDLCAAYRCLTFDNRGIGQCRPAGCAITIEQMAEDVLALMDAQGWASAHVVGHSMGGLIAQHLAWSSPSRVRSLALLCTFANGADATRLSWDMFWTGLRTYVGTRAMRRRAFVELVLPPGLNDREAWAARLAPIFGHDLADQPRVVMKQLAAMRAYDATPRLPALAGVPTLIVGARHDRIATRDIVQGLAGHLPHGHVVEFDEAAHGVTIQCAERVNQLLREHFKRSDSQE